MKVFVAVPTAYGDMRIELFHGLKDASFKQKFDVVFCQSSFTPYNFNKLWCKALNDKSYTHFAMVHTDLHIDAGWLDRMLFLMTSHEADILGAIIPIKTDDGKTSTAIDGAKDSSDPEYDKQVDPFLVRPITMEEVLKLPATFTHEKLLVNSGCMLVDFSKPWVTQIRFSFSDFIFQNDGKFYPKSFPEDWQFCRDAKALGAKIYATREIPLVHIGGGRFPNYEI